MSNLMTGWAKTPWGVKPKAEKVNESPSTHPLTPPSSSSSSIGSHPHATKSSRNKNDVWDEITHHSSSLKKSIDKPVGKSSRQSSWQEQSPQHFIPNNSIEDALKVSYRKDLSPPLPQKQQQPQNKKISPLSNPVPVPYSSAVHLNHKKMAASSSLTPPSSPPPSSVPLYHEGSKLKPNEKPHRINLLPTAAGAGAGGGGGGDHLTSLSNNDNYLSQQQENESSEKYQSDTEMEGEGEGEEEEQYAHYQSDDESDALRSLPPNPPFLNTELSSDFETEYEENNPLQDLLPLPLSQSQQAQASQKSYSKIPKGRSSQKNPTALAYAGNPFGSLQQQQQQPQKEARDNGGTVSRKMRSQSPSHETDTISETARIPQTKTKTMTTTIKVQDEDSEGFPVSQQKRRTPEKSFTLTPQPQSLSPQSPSQPPQSSQLSSPLTVNSLASRSESRSSEETKVTLSGDNRDLPPPPPPPQPHIVQSSPSEFDSDLLIDGTEITLTHKIGEGFFGEVWKAKWNHTQDIAVKKMKHEVTNPNDRNTFFSEVYSLAKLRHPNITIFYGVTSPPDAYIVSELLSSSLFQLIHGYKNDPTPMNLMFPLPVILRILRDVASGGAYLHKRKPPIIHRDLSSSNVLLSVSPTSSPEELLRACADENRPVAKLTDFGLSRNVDWYMTSCVGNLFYLAPEVFSGDHYTQSADVYSFGILIWELVSRVSPYPSESPQRAAFLAATRGMRPCHMTTDSRTPPDLAYLREKCWHGDPLERPTFHDVLSKLGEMMTMTPTGVPNRVAELPYPDRSSESQYSDQFSTAPVETLSHLWDRRCRELSRLLLRKPQVELLLQRHILLSHPDPQYVPKVAPMTTGTPLRSQKKSITIPQQLAKQRLVPKSKK